jgi:hypothetical protein
MKFLRVMLKEIRETIIYASRKDQVELLLRGISAGGLLAIFISDSKLLACLVFMVSLWMKKSNERRK